MSTTPAQLLQLCRDYECETLPEVLLSVAESSKHCTSEGGGRIPTWPLKEAAARLEALERRVEGLRAMHRLIATNLGEYIDREGSVDVTVALAFETARAGCAP
jgi:hypothetical protein